MPRKRSKQKVRRAIVPKDAFRASRGMLKGRYSTKEFLRWRREERRREDAKSLR